MRFEKLGRAALLGHLDLVRELPRILRRAGAELLYSRGFHPKPSMAFGPALALGVPSFDEYVDVKLAAPMGPDQLVREASRASPSGIRFLAAARLDPAEPPIGKLVARCRYLVGLPRERWESAGGRAELAVRIEKLLGAEAVRVTRRVDASHTREIDARPHVISIEPGGEEGAARFVDAGIPGDFFALAVELRVLPSGAVRPAEVVAAMLGEAAVPVRAIRIAQLRAGGEPVMPEARGPKPEA
jgi:radical SAM-linked protein